MNVAKKPKVAEIFTKNKYTFEENQSQLKIIRSRSGSIFRLVVFNLVALILLIIGLLPPVNFLLIATAGAVGCMPGLADRKTWPFLIIIDKLNQTILLKHGPYFSQNLKFSDITSLIVDEYVLDSDTSPFKEGYQDFDYAFFLLIADRRIKLVKFSFRHDNAEQMQILFNYFQKTLKL